MSDALTAARLDVRLRVKAMQRHRRSLMELFTAIKLQSDLELAAAGNPERLTREQVREIFCDVLDLNVQHTTIQ